MRQERCNKRRIKQPHVESPVSLHRRSFSMHPAARVLHEQVTHGKTPGVQYLPFSADSILFRDQDGVSRVEPRVPVTPATTFNGFSVTKTATAVSVLQLVESGELTLDAPVASYLPDTPYEGITIR